MSDSADFHIYDKFIERAKKFPALKTAVAWPLSDVALGGAVEAAEAGVIDPILVGPEAAIKDLAAKLKLDLSRCTIKPAETDVQAAQIAVALCRAGEAQALMKGSLHTDDLLRPVVARETGLRTSSRISHVFVLDPPSYSRTILVTDAAINIAPELEDKMHILQNAINLALALGIEKPKVAILSAVENVNPKMPSTLDAAALCKMADRGQITGAILDGPLAIDAAVSLDSAKIKKIASPVAGQADIFLVPNIESGNIMAKQLHYIGGAKIAGIVLGARVPIILTSRADSAESRLMSCAIASLAVNGAKK
jgi:phosphate acetyltransferase